MSFLAWGHVHGSRSSTRNNTSVSLNYRRQKTPNGVNNLTFLRRLSYKSKHSFNPLNTGSECKNLRFDYYYFFFLVLFFSVFSPSGTVAVVAPVVWAAVCRMARAKDVRSLWMMLERIRKLECMCVFSILLDAAYFRDKKKKAKISPQRNRRRYDRKHNR